tara:strand:- start:455 stop:634 length:180 start_codon:yes stop_codon:yes gene_type:complete
MGMGQSIERENYLRSKKNRKARAKQFGKVEIPQEAFIGVLKINKDNYFFESIKSNLSSL